MKLLGVSRALARRIIERGKDTYGTIDQASVALYAQG